MTAEPSIRPAWIQVAEILDRLAGELVPGHESSMEAARVVVDNTTAIRALVRVAADLCANP